MQSRPCHACRGVLRAHECTLCRGAGTLPVVVLPAAGPRGLNWRTRRRALEALQRPAERPLPALPPKVSSVAPMGVVRRLEQLERLQQENRELRALCWQLLAAVGRTM